MTDNDPLEDDGVQVKLSGRKDSTSSKISNRRDDECCLVKRPVKICLRVCLILFILAVLFFIGVLIWYEAQLPFCSDLVLPANPHGCKCGPVFAL